MIGAAARAVVLGAVAAAGIGALAAGEARAVEAVAQNQPPRRMPRLNTLRDVGLALEICWEANEPPLAQARPGMNVTVMLTFTKKGEILGEPRFTYVTPEASQETRALYEQAVVAAINTCTPLPLSEALGNALAGSPKIMPFIDRRNQKGI
ncbi:MAG TPA: hypothetical protein VLX44_19585 [Xanthobacteraceae bacterium]|nr:hypothetical protein [Xanthobacteraceae bacterium]